MVYLPVGGRLWPAVVDTGFNGALELPEALQSVLPHRFAGHVRSALAAGRFVWEDSYRVEFPFDGESIRVMATFSACEEILLGTRILRDHEILIDFPNRRLTLVRTR
jgi:predicted aspartyl protease